ncbi:aminotransferase class V-fold PLP-dependent enzyme [Albimonas sp. CAU 1670]|uniref:cysteine desulfurase family protein n=1 Tax=Albimonas sp. CAU 1670 TaxID=3032599 RepID=UPI0023D9ED9C|nr:aminotransferase class V-fold PLP-dependent enzyme [Albimonas sp. CAU 1670]MDF2232549.1 aminotransferase class V-fold PLP-dependent enzyme [Albimonas sp. CAU 1670]
MTQPRAYLDWNATAPLRLEAKSAMLAAMDLAGNPSSVHAEGRAARAAVERARAQVAALVGCAPGEVIFTSGATEAAATALASGGPVTALATEHDCVLKWAERIVPVDRRGLAEAVSHSCALTGTLAWGGASGETGVIQPAPPQTPARILADLVQAAGKLPSASIWTDWDMALLSAHKLGGPKGVGALILREGREIAPLLRGGGQELSRRSGTENVVGIAGFGAAAEAALADLETGVWARVETLRDALEARLRAAAPELVIVGEGAPRLPNTACFALPGWRGETQVMQMDLAGFAVSAGSACSSGKAGPSRALAAMGLDAQTAGSAIRVSLGPTTTEAEVMGFAAAWEDRYRRLRLKSA